MTLLTFYSVSQSLSCAPLLHRKNYPLQSRRAPRRRHLSWCPNDCFVLHQPSSENGLMRYCHRYYAWWGCVYHLYSWIYFLFWLLSDPLPVSSLFFCRLFVDICGLSQVSGLVAATPFNPCLSKMKLPRSGPFFSWWHRFKIFSILSGLSHSPSNLFHYWDINIIWQIILWSMSTMPSFLAKCARMWQLAHFSIAEQWE